MSLQPFFFKIFSNDGFIDDSELTEEKRRDRKITKFKPKTSGFFVNGGSHKIELVELEMTNNEVRSRNFSFLCLYLC